LYGPAYFFESRLKVSAPLIDYSNPDVVFVPLVGSWIDYIPQFAMIGAALVFMWVVFKKVLR